ncbi:hypothetical protein [Salinibacterium sp. ZJ450]|uniref:hypothetical protein n=1 Tax=Salinibacterium sp. ZJ450 TaxID=2708338 RepID=UPI0014220984|nr:hypothetical protein [Salinibacterium sp. ZJ450]
MAIIRSTLPFEKDFTRIPNKWVRDPSISLRARGLLAQLLSHKPGWHITIESLVRGNPEGRDAIRTSIGELTKAGYLTIERKRDWATGQMDGRDYVLSDPDAAEDSVSNPVALETRTTAFPHDGEPPTKKNSFNNTMVKKTRKPAGGPAVYSKDAFASKAQVNFLRDCFILLHAQLPTKDQLDEWAHWSSFSADEEIQESWSEIESRHLLLPEVLGEFRGELSSSAIRYIERRFPADYSTSRRGES